LPTQIELLATLQLVDQSLRAKTDEVAESEQRVGELEEAVAEQLAAVTAARAELAALASRQRELEAKLSANEAQAKDRRMRIARIRNEKELSATRREIDLLKEESAAVETEAIGVLEQVEVATAKVGELEERLAATKVAMDQEAATLQEKVTRLGADIESDRAQRTRLIETLDGDLRRRYEMILERRGGIAVVEVREGACQGCRMRVPPQLFNEIQRNQQVILCPSCQRMLYWRSERAEEVNG
jgi:predicted  nucleic acid-binding Zn-ribbon protein